MSKYLYLVFFLACSMPAVSQEISGEALLQKTIAYHDPQNVWPSFNGKFQISSDSPEGGSRINDITLDLPQQYFALTTSTDGVKAEQIVDKGKCHFSLNGSTQLSEEDMTSHRLSCERANTMKNYYTYLYGLPMKLSDPGTLIDPKVGRRNFKGKEYLVLKVKYEEGVGKDIWYFYFNPKSYALEVYQFYHDETKNDGEYILLSGTENAFGIKMPKSRAWYLNKDNKYLGTDVLVKVTSL
ncbi:MAG: DUF6503 family protein [Maribacter sp.]|nr:DUF6503 family protein [Maribacter sp.]